MKETNPLDLALGLDQIRQTLGFFSCSLLCGECPTERHETELRKSLDNLDAQRQAIDQAECRRNIAEETAHMATVDRDAALERERKLAKALHHVLCGQASKHIEDYYVRESQEALEAHTQGIAEAVIDEILNEEKK